VVHVSSQGAPELTVNPVGGRSSAPSVPAQLAEGI
jgi:hypothetical protein